MIYSQFICPPVIRNVCTWHYRSACSAGSRFWSGWRYFTIIWQL